MVLVPVDFGVSSNDGRFGHDGTALLTNCYAEALGPEGKAPIAIYASHGLKSFTSVTQTITRGLLTLDNVLLAVIGTQLYEVQTDGSTTAVGGIGDTGKVSMSRNSKANTPQVVISTQGGLRFLYEDGELTSISDSDLPPPNSNTYLDGYTMYGINDGRIFYSEINDAANISSLNFFEAEASPDKLKGIIAVSRQLFAVGEDTIEVFQNTGAANNPFTRLRGAPIAKGCLATGTIKEFAQTFAWVGDDGRVYVMSGYTPQVISNHYIERLIDEEATPDNLTADVYRMRGHEFYILSGTNFTVAYDAGAGWHDKTSSGLTRWRGQCITKYGEKWICGDQSNGNLYEIDPDTYNENGEDMTMRIRSPIQHNTPNRLQYNSLYLDFVTGVGLNTTDVHNSDPKVMLRYSDDGAKSWSNERTRSLGEIGEYKTRVKFSRLGTDRYHGRTFEIAVSAQVARGFLGAYADVMQAAA